MRIGLIVDEFNREGGGAERWTAQFADHLLEAGHEVHVITFQGPARRDSLEMHVLPDPRSLYGRAMAVEAAVGGLGPMVLRDRHRLVRPCVPPPDRFASPQHGAGDPLAYPVAAAARGSIAAAEPP